VDDLVLQISLQPNGLPVLEPLKLTISKSGGKAEQLSDVAAWFRGLDMDMGQHPFLFKNGTSLSSDAISASGMIPICSIDPNMVWRLTVQFKYLDVWAQVLFDLKAKH
jgi:hypothetical protein